MERSRRFVGQAEAGRGRRVWDKQQRRWWGPVFAGQPDEILRELNGAKRPVGAPGAGGCARSLDCAAAWWRAARADRGTLVHRFGHPGGRLPEPGARAPVAGGERAKLLFEGAVLPTRAYLPREDVLVPLIPTDRRTQCAYKGEASYFTVGEHENLAWTYEQPLRGAADIAGLVAFFNEHVDLILDGEALPRAVTPWS